LLRSFPSLEEAGNPESAKDSVRYRIEGEHPYLYLDGTVMKRNWTGEVRNVSLLVASAINLEGFREILGICEVGVDSAIWSR
jgi:putative transposase